MYIVGWSSSPAKQSPQSVLCSSGSSISDDCKKKKYLSRATKKRTQAPTHHQHKKHKFKRCKINFKKTTKVILVYRLNVGRLVEVFENNRPISHTIYMQECWLKRAVCSSVVFFVFFFITKDETRCNDNTVHFDWFQIKLYKPIIYIKKYLQNLFQYSWLKKTHRLISICVINHNYIRNTDE